MVDWTVYTRNRALERTGEVDDYRRLECTARFNAVGSWEVELDGDSPAVDLLTFGASVELIRDGATVFSGPVTRRERSWDGERRTALISGADHLVWLARRLALPVTSGPPYTAQAYDVRTGPAETVVLDYVDFNAGANASTPRRVPSLTVEATGGLGSTVTGRGRFHPLLDSLLEEVALAGGDLGIRVALTAAPALQVQVYAPADKTGTVRFSEDLGNLRGWRYAIEAPGANYVIVGGGGEGTARVFEEGGDSASISTYGRIEAFLDARQTSTASELRQLRDEHLSANAEQTLLEIDPVDVTGTTWVDDYDLGDQVTVVVDGETVADVVREVTVTVDDDGVTVRPSVGAPNPPGSLGIYDLLRGLRRRLTTLEVR